MANNCKFCNRLKDDIERTQYHNEQARKNGRQHVNEYDKYVAAFCHQSYVSDIPCGRMTVIFDELNFCPLCGTDLKSILENIV